MEDFLQTIQDKSQAVLLEVTSLEFYGQIAVIFAALFLAWALTRVLSARVGFFREEPQAGLLLDVRKTLHAARKLLFPLAALLSLGLATGLGGALLGEVWLIRSAQGIAMIFLVYSLASHFIQNDIIILLLKWIGIPIALLYILDLHNEVIAYLESVTFELGNINISLYALVRTIIFGIVLFWLGRLSSRTGQRVIRNQPALDVGTREVIAKLFEIAIFAVIFILLLNVMGIDLTALAVFGGALGVGLGFGLQQIASNFISGIIILIDRTLTIGDYIELEDGRTGTLRELTMRSATLETFDGKEIMVPNERFITTAFVNCTHTNTKQRYSLNFQVAYGTDLPKLFDIVRETVDSHPKVLSGDDLPVAEKADAEIEGFGDSGIDILVEFWMEGIDDGENRVGADLLLMIWMALQQHGIEIPFPQREIKILDAPKPA
jgi:small-conductance mechanosensitive channel